MIDTKSVLASWGDPSLVDRVILAQLAVVGVAYWILLLLAATDGGRLRDFMPAAFGLAHRLGRRGLAGVLLAAVLLLAHGWFLSAAVEQLHPLPGGRPVRFTGSMLRDDIQIFSLLESAGTSVTVDLPFDLGTFHLPADDFLNGCLKQLHRPPLRGLWMLAACCLSLAFFSTFFCRLLGGWCYRTRPRNEGVAA